MYDLYITRVAYSFTSIVPVVGS